MKRLFAAASTIALLAAVPAAPPAHADESASKVKEGTSATSKADPKSGDAADAKPAHWGPLSEEEFKALHQPPKDAKVELHGEMIDLAGGKAYLSLPSGVGPFPGIIVIQEWWGLNDHIKHCADRLAGEGYAAIAVDLYDGQIATDSDTAMKLMGAVNDAAAEKIIHAAHSFLKTDERVNATNTGVIGWCFGGGWALRTAIEEPDLDAAVIYYGRLIDDPQQLMQIHARVLGIFGTKDKGIPQEAVASFDAALTKAEVQHEIYSYEAEHAFANPSNAIYDEKSAAAAWEKTRKLLDKSLKKKR
jgi:carboxymethylenebutenolidase